MNGGTSRIVPYLFLGCILALSAGGCDRVKEVVEGFTRRGGAAGGKSGEMSDRQRVLRKFGEPAEKRGLGKAVRTEQGIRYNRKWNYYYSTPKGDGPSMRTVYFVDGRFSGSAIRHPDNTWVKENIRFAY